MDPSTMSNIPLMISLNDRPQLVTSVGFVFTPSTIHHDASSLISSRSAVSTNIFIKF